MRKTEVAEDFTLGLDLGIASVGWALIDANADEIVGCGVRTFDAPEMDKDRTPKNQKRREARLLRRVGRRRRQRIAQVRKLCEEHLGAEALSIPPQMEPWNLRAAALDQALSKAQLAAVLLHIAKHRGFLSNRKGGEANAVDEDKKALVAIAGLAEKMVGYRSFGEMLATDPAFAGRKRNRPNDYGRTPKRDWLRSEIALLMRRQRELGSDFATEALEQAFAEVAFLQRPLQDSEALVRECAFEPGEKRASKFAPSFERFRLLQNLSHLRLWISGHPDRALTKDEIAAVERHLGKQASLTYKTVRKILDFSPGVRFRGVPLEREGRDVTTSGSQGGSRGIRMLRQALGPNSYDKIGEPTLDDVMARIAFRETAASIEHGLRALGLEEAAIDRLMSAVDAGEFGFATGAAHVSAKACRAILPGLRDGLVYSEACTQAGYDHASPGAEALSSVSRPATRKALVEIFADGRRSPIASPVARKALIEGIKQVAAIVHEHPALAGRLPGAVHVELARDIGKGPEERRQIENGIRRRGGEIEKAEAEFASLFGRPPRRGTLELRIYELAKEQNWRCVYTDDAIDPSRLLDGVSYQIDHILSWSRFGDDSFVNLTLCAAAANQAKQDRTPYEWYEQGEELLGRPLDWEAFQRRVEAMNVKGLKKRNYLLANATEREEAFRERNLNDTKFAARLLLRAVTLMYPPGLADDGKSRRRCFARPGALTSKLRRAWGVEGLKKDDRGKRRDDDRHHALDAIVVAATSESVLNRLTKAHQKAERLGKPREFETMDPPWPSFREDVAGSIKTVFVSRAERRRARGQVHLETVYSVEPETERVMERLTPARLLDGVKSADDALTLQAALAERLPRPERSKAIVAELTRWQLAGRPKDAPPLGPTGDPIGKIRVYAKLRPAVPIRGGSAERGDIVRTDVFRAVGRHGKAQFFLVPVYPHQIGDPQPPLRAIKQGAREEDWPVLTAEHEFLFTLWPLSLVRLTKPDGEIIEGYLRSVDRNTGALTISPDTTLTTTRKGIGARTLLSLEKLHVDRLGRIHAVARETRTWHGEAFTSAKPLG